MLLWSQVIQQPLPRLSSLNIISNSEPPLTDLKRIKMNLILYKKNVSEIL